MTWKKNYWNFLEKLNYWISKYFFIFMLKIIVLEQFMWIFLENRFEQKKVKNKKFLLLKYLEEKSNNNFFTKIFKIIINILMIGGLFGFFLFFKNINFDLTSIFYYIVGNIKIFIVPICLLISGLFVILLKNPIYSLLNLIIVFLATSIYLISINVEFLAYLYLIIYIGAIAILFLFVIMLFNLKSLQNQNYEKKKIMFLSWSLIIFFFIFLKFFYWTSFEINQLIENIVFYQKTNLNFEENLINTELFKISQTLYSYYGYLFLIIGIILLVSMIGSIVLALSTNRK